MKIENLIDEYKNVACNIILLQNQIKVLEEDLLNKKKELEQVNLKEQSLSVAIAFLNQEDEKKEKVD